MSIDKYKDPFIPIPIKPMGFLDEINNNSTGSLGIDMSPILAARAKQTEEEERKRKRAEGFSKLRNFAESLQAMNAGQSGNFTAQAQFLNNIDARRANEIARAKEEQQKRDFEKFYNSLSPIEKKIIDLKKAGFPDSYIKALLYPDSSGNKETSLMQNAAALAEKRKRYANMSDDEKMSKEGKLLLQEINDFAGLGGALKYDARTAFDLSSAETSGKQGVSFGDGPLTKGEVSTDEKFGTFYVNYIEKGRGAKNIANAERLEDAEFILKYAAKNGIGISGVPAGIIANRPTLSAFFNPEGVMSQERVASVIQQSLKEILGGQFTEKEGIALIQRGYNPSLSPEENLERLLDLKAQVDQIVESEQSAVNYYENNNKSLRDYKGKKYTKEDFNRDLIKDYTMDVIELTDQELEDAFMKANEDSLWIKTLEKEITRRADKKR